MNASAKGSGRTNATAATCGAVYGDAENVITNVPARTPGAARSLMESTFPSARLWSRAKLVWETGRVIQSSALDGKAACSRWSSAKRCAALPLPVAPKLKGDEDASRYH